MVSRSSPDTSTIALIEERNPDYDPKRFYPVRIGERLDKYKLVSKLGLGTGSTVWLARTIRRLVQWRHEWKIALLTDLKLAMAI